VSRAEPASLPVAPTLRGALRLAAGDFYYHSVRLVPVNAVWGVVFAVLFLASVRAPAVLVLTGVLGLPTLALFRVAGGIVRGGSVEVWDGVREARRRPLAAIGGALVAALVALVLVVNVLLGLVNPGIVGWTLFTMAVWGLFVLWTGALAFWALLADPGRHRGVRAATRLAALLLVAHPVRLGAFGLLAGVLAIVSSVMILPILTISVAFIALLACHFVLPAGDRLEAALEARHQPA